MRAHVIGSGVAAVSVTALLAARDFAVTREAVARRWGPVVVLNPTTIDLLQRLFHGVHPALADSHSLKYRSVRWTVDANQVTLPAPALVISEAQLVAALTERTWNKNRVSDSARNGAWRILARGRGTDCADRQSFGSRQIRAAEFILSGPATTSVLESTTSGWVFMVPMGRRRAFVQAAVVEKSTNPRQDLLDLVAQTRDIRA